MFASWRRPFRILNINVKRKGGVNQNDRYDNESYMAINAFRGRRRSPDDWFSQESSPTALLDVARRVGEIPHTNRVSDELRQPSLVGPSREEHVAASHLAHRDASNA